MQIIWKVEIYWKKLLTDISNLRDLFLCVMVPTFPLIWKSEVGKELKTWQQIVIYKQMCGKIELMQDFDGGMVAWGFIMHPPMIDLFTLAAYCRQLKRF